MSSLFGAIGGLIGGKYGGVDKPAPTVNYTPPGFSGGGLNATFSGNGYTVSPSADRTAAVGGIASTFGQQATALGNIGAQFAPGFSALRTAQLGQINSNRTAAIGDLRQNLQSRRVLGSSFAQDVVNRTQAQYDQQQQDTIAKTYLEELQASQQLIQQQYTAARGQFQTGLDEMNLEANVAADLTGKASATLASTATTQAQLDSWFQANKANFYAGVGSMVGQGVGQAAMAMGA